MAKARILVVDDEEDIRLILRTTLQDEFEVVEAHDGLDALEKLERYEPDFVCLDVMMPLLDGFATCQMIRKNPKYDDMPIMFLTAMGGSQNMREGYGKGANLYLTKPFETERLLKNIRVQLGEHRVRHKRYSLEQIRSYESNKNAPHAPGSDAFEIPAIAGAHKQDKAFRTTTALPKPSLTAPEQKPRVLVVDDDKDILLLMSSVLEDFFEVVTAEDGIQAVQYLVKYQPEMMVIDIMIPKMNGLQLCESLRNNKAFSELPILICSAKCRDKDIAVAKKVGANDFLAKPFEPHDLIRQLKQLQTVPGYRYRAHKKITWQEILDERAPKNEPTDVFETSVDHRSQLEKMSQDAIRQAVDELERSDAPSNSPEKKKRRLFGFGSKD
jgi:DNA-binding response OmpR family regulator